MAIPAPPPTTDLEVGDGLPSALVALRASIDAVRTALGSGLPEQITAEAVASLTALLATGRLSAEALNASYLTLLGSAEWNPTNQATTSSTSATLLHLEESEILLVEFTVPAAGDVTVFLEAAGRQVTSGYLQFGLRDGAGTAIATSKRAVAAAGGGINRQTAIIRLDPDALSWTRGESKTLRFALASSDGVGSAQVFAGNRDGGGTGDPVGPATMEVYATP